jgi:hypothetical protein
VAYADAKITEARARGDVAAVKFWTRVRDVVDQAPPMSVGLAARLTVVMRTEPADLEEAA